MLNLCFDPILFLLLQAFLDEVAQAIATLTPKISLEQLQARLIVNGLVLSFFVLISSVLVLVAALSELQEPVDLGLLLDFLSHHWYRQGRMRV